MFHHDAPDCTRVQIDEWGSTLPETTPAQASGEPQRERLHAQIGARLAAKRAQYPGEILRAEILSPRWTGGRVPHGDVMFILDALHEHGVRDVVFEGRATPIGRRDRDAHASRSRDKNGTGGG